MTEEKTKRYRTSRKAEGQKGQDTKKSSYRCLIALQTNIFVLKLKMTY